mgnify:FL=1
MQLTRGLKKSFKWLSGSLIIILFFLQGTGLINIALLTNLEGNAADLRMISTLKGGVDERIVIVDIDEKSLTKYGQWPWNRHYLAELVDTLFQHYQIKVLGFDLVFAEPAGNQFSALEKEFKTRSDVSPQAKQALAFEALQDAEFAKIISQYPITLGIFFNQAENSQLNQLPPAISQLDSATNTALSLPKPVGYTANLELFNNASSRSGFFDNPVVDRDGKFRRVPLFQSYQGQLFPSLALSVAQQALDNPELDIQMVQQGEYLAITSIQLGHRVVNTDQGGAVQIPFRGGEGSFPYISVADILSHKTPLEQLEGKIILLGTSAPGLLDLRSTPVDESMPGVEVHANIIAGILDQNIPQQPAYLIAVQSLGYLILGLFLLITPHFLSPLKTLALSVVLIISSLVVNFSLWQQGLMFPLATPILLIISFFIFHMSWGFFIESRHKRAITRLFGQYVPPQLVKEMAKQPEQITLDGQSKELTVLFADVRNFTNISEAISPKELTLLMNQILTPMTEAIYRNMGTVDKYMGDAVMAFWGAPVEQLDHATKAILSALGMQKKIRVLSEHLQTKGHPEIAIGIGINTGIMSVGNMGSKYRMAYSVMGDPVNLGSRLEGLTKVYGARIIVSETCQQQAPEFLYRMLDKVRVKGKKEPIRILEPLARLQKCQFDDIRKATLLNDAIENYCQRDWLLALDKLDNIEQYKDEDYLKVVYLYRQRIKEFQQTPPPEDWDCVFTFTEK